MAVGEIPIGRLRDASALRVFKSLKKLVRTLASLPSLPPSSSSTSKVLFSKFLFSLILTSQTCYFQNLLSLSKVDSVTSTSAIFMRVIDLIFMDIPVAFSLQGFPPVVCQLSLFLFSADFCFHEISDRASIGITSSTAKYRQLSITRNAGVGRRYVQGSGLCVNDI
ncbi:hypothetical protein L218DRAFT_583727 [Marasmius fiardii PR-910]|nr:hypothetical protein L218DRAFT_583727 [Marasmius fiardii PR-910]